MPGALRRALHVSALPTGATQACVPRAAVPGGRAHTDGLHYVRWLALRAGGLGTGDTLSLPFLASIPSPSPIVFSNGTKQDYKSASGAWGPGRGEAGNPCHWASWSLGICTAASLWSSGTAQVEETRTTELSRVPVMPQA